MCVRQSVPCTDLGHNPVSASPLLVFEQNIGVVVPDEILELRTLSPHAAVSQPGGTQRVFTHVGDVLLEHQGGQLPGSTTSARAST